ncbi:OmpA family protein [Actinophytocola sp.]|uniref:OmpA family protein n=1 Tax=Actinophytocola sp. TaxID=1872138 RepID=UPI002ED45982
MTHRPAHLRARIVTAVLSAGIAATACTTAETSPTPTPECLVNSDLPFVAAVGARANNPAPEMPAEVNTLIDRTGRAGEKITLIRADGKPEVSFARAFTTTAKNSVATDKDFRRFVGDLGQAFAEASKAKTAEADPLTALTLAGRSTPHGGNVVLLDSGLQTVAPLRFQDDDGALLNADPKEVVEHLRALELLPDLEGRNVMLVGLGNVVAPQEPLDQRLHQRVIDIWSEIAEAGGAACVEVVDTPADVAKPVPGVPAVTPVPVPEPPPAPRPCGETVLNDRNDVGFRPDEDVFVDEGAARKTIGQVADVMRDGRQRAELIGTTANVGGYDGQVALSKRRAAAVQRVLVDLGIAEGRLTTTGQGSRFDGYQQDHGPGGELLPGPAANNRKVIVRLVCTD